ncbi:transposase [Aliikangiella sp. IMCC44359]|uniref:transposase n=1 Tax=Aliikangiella sp. IMCC44359 TaxID=3459125 RepID=UPI00403A9EF6
MARQPRLNLPGVPQHVIQRGNNREVCFFEEQDYKVYLSKLEEYSQKLKVSVHAYVLMTNHVHLLMTPKTSDGVSRLMQSLGRYYVRYINHKYERTGTLWEGRYKSTLIDSEQYLLTVSRYIELNPVRAEMVAQPGEYPWSSFRRNGLGVAISLITPHEVYERLAKTDKTRQKRYLALFEKTLSEYTLEEIRQSVNRAWVLGSSKFKQQIEKKTGRQAEPRQRGGDRKSESFKRKNQIL